MSGSSFAQRMLSRCTLSMNAGISISWAPDPSGSIAHGQRHHEREETQFRARMDAATPAIEVLFDELETAGHTFHAPGEAEFPTRAQRGDTGMPIISVSFWSEPALTPDALKALATRVGELVTHAVIKPPREPAPQVVVVEQKQKTKPWWKIW